VGEANQVVLVARAPARDTSQAPSSACSTHQQYSAWPPRATTSGEMPIRPERVGQLGEVHSGISFR
jgi:hypothetical protein